MASPQTTTAVRDQDVEFRLTLERLATLVVFCALLGVVGVYAIAPISAYRWRQIPFFGAFVEPTLLFNGVGPKENPDWVLLHNELTYPDRLIAIDSQPIRTPDELYARLAQYSVGDVIDVTYEKAAGNNAGEQSISVTLVEFPPNDFANFFIIPYLVGLAFLATGLWVFYLRHDDMAGRAFAFFCGSMAIVIGLIFDLYTTKLLASLWTACLAIVGGSIFTMGLVFPQEASYVAKRPLLRWSAFLPALILVAIGVWKVHDLAHPRDYATAWLWSFIFMSGGAIFFILTMLYRWRRAGSPVIREQSRITLLATAAAFGPAIAWVIVSAFTTYFRLDLDLKFSTLLFVPMVLFPIGITIAIMRYRMLNVEYVLNRSVVYTLLGVFTVVGYWLVIYGLSLIIGANIAANSPLALAGLVFVLVLAFNPLRMGLQKWVDGLFFRGSQAYREQLQAYSRTLTGAADLPYIISELHKQIESAIQPTHNYIYLRDSARAEYTAYTAAGRPETDIYFNADGALARALANQRILYLAADIQLPASLQRDRAKLAVLASPLYVPLNSKGGLIGWLTLGERLSGDPYTRQDLEFLEAIADQSALAIERAQVVSALEKRVNELNVLSRVSQAINFAIEFDDLLELIYAQAGRVLDVRNFTIILHEPRANTLSYAFFVENNDRDTSRENKPWAYGQGLASEVIRAGQAIATDEYLEECRRRRVQPLDRPYRAWLGVPLSAGSKTLGAMTIASTESRRPFTDDQIKIFAAIADQAATAIDKARLFEQSQKRAKQLDTLNQVARAITSTLDLDELLERVLQSAVDILLCEAGSLFLIDADSNDAILRTAVGPVGKDLIGLRVPSGRGIVGETMATGKPEIVNDTAHDPRFFQAVDQKTGFVSRAIIAAPLQFKDRIIGVIQIINKRDGTPFDDEDVGLLTAFAGQAAVAIENARLFGLTDRALNERVEELSVMQRIDRDLNAALDLKRAMTVVLTRALFNADADAGFAGVIIEGRVFITAHQGYGDGILPYLEAPIPTDQGLIQQLMRHEEAILVTDVQAQEDYIAILPEVASQLLSPIRREDETIGIIVLESRATDVFTPARIEFVTRLANRAAFAVANSLLFNEVTAANQAKSEFVSMVSHELKNPMASIKGFTQLLLTGTAGPVNEGQQQFLKTVLSNVERMITIVSDLTDIARIESGRLHLTPKPMQFQNVIAEVVRSLQGAYDAKEQTLVLEVEPNLPLVMGDQVRLVQALTNLVSNAHKYSPPKSIVTLRAEPSSNYWDPKGAPEVLHVVVQDTGYGISPADQKKLFTKFFRADNNLSEAPGTGLGLSIVKQMVELGGGRVWFESELGKGSTFHFTIPLAIEGS
jgi:signal transduction histidine kinase